MGTPKFVTLVACAAVAAPFAQSAVLTEAHSRAFGPQTTVYVARPTLRWEVWPGRGSDVTDAEMTINGKPVRARYDRQERVLLYTPTQPLQPGQYRVEAKVVVDSRLPVEKNWAFKVDARAVPELPAPNTAQRVGISQVNGYRRLLGLPAFQADDRLSAAAQKHCEYLAANNRTGHFQKSGEPLFIGERPGDRLDAFGYSDDSWEGVDFGADTPEESVRRLFDAPYHRIPFMQPGQTVLGAGFQGQRMTLEFGMNHEEGVVVSPADGQREIPLDWSGHERPDPLRIHSLKAPTGYPIVFAYFSASDDKIKVTSAKLTTALGKEVKISLNTPQNDDHLDCAAIILPNQPLEPFTGYTVTVKAFTPAGVDISRTWKFVTEK